MKRHTVRLLATYFLGLLFPIGIWLGLLGYELQSLFCLIFGWTPVSAYFGIVFSTEVTDIQE